MREYKKTVKFKEDMKNQVNKKILGGYVLYNDKYLISMYNEVPYKLFKNGKPYLSTMREIKINKCGLNKNGVKYFYKTIGIDGSSRKYLHRITWIAFNGDIPKGYVIDHIDGNKENNSLNNLQLLTRAANSLKTYNKTTKGGVLVKQVMIKCIETNKMYFSIKEAAQDLPGNKMSNRSMISNHVNKKLVRGYLIKRVKGFTYEKVLNG